MDGRSSCDDWKGAALSPFLALDSVVTASTPDSVAPAGIRFLISGLALSVFLTVTTIAMLGPLLVDMSQDMGVTVPLMAQLVAVASGMWAITALLAGPCSDAYGRKPVLLLGLCLLAGGSLGIAFATSFGLAALSCGLLGIGGGMVPPTCVSLVGDTVRDDQKPMSIALLTMQPGLSSVVGVPLVVLLASSAGWRAPFVVLGAMLLVAAVTMLILAPYNRASQSRLNLAERLLRVGSFPGTWFMAMTNVMSRMSWGALITFFPAYLIVTYDLQTADVALPWAAVAVGATAAPLLGGRIARLKSRLRIIAVMLLAAAVPGFSVFVSNSGVWQVVLVAGVFVLLSAPLMTVLLILTAETGGTSRGTLSGVISSSNWGGTAAGAALGGVLVAQFGFGALSYLLCGAIVVGAVLMAVGVNDRAVQRAREYYVGSERSVN